MTDRNTHAYEGDIVLFLIGMRIHRPWRVNIVGRAFTAMPKLIAELEEAQAAAAAGAGPDLGYLGGRLILDGLHPTVIQFWRTTEDLYGYAASDDTGHRAVWRDFYRYAKADPRAMTLWHETYAIPAGAHESIYLGPEQKFGLAGLAGAIPVGRRGERAATRMRQRDRAGQLA